MITRDQSSFQWDGTQYSYPAWNQNQNLSSAMKNSVNWYFQTLDKKIGFMNLQNYFNRVGYGNCNLSGGISDYWLESSLKISPVEQVRLLKSFYTNQFGFEQFNIDTVKSALLLSQQNGNSLSGKTGTGTVNGKNVNGWFIGYVETNGNTYFFATNIQSRNNASGSVAAKITLSILNEKNIYKSES
jgi:bla regulator protein BlaR1